MAAAQIYCTPLAREIFARAYHSGAIEKTLQMLSKAKTWAGGHVYIKIYIWKRCLFISVPYFCLFIVSFWRKNGFYTQSKPEKNQRKRFSQIFCNHLQAFLLDFDMFRFRYISFFQNIPLGGVGFWFAKITVDQSQAPSSYVHKYTRICAQIYAQIFANICEYMLICDVKARSS